jgi:hypothetical protein
MADFRNTRRNWFWNRFYFRKQLPLRLLRGSVFTGIATFAYYWHRRD